MIELFDTIMYRAFGKICDEFLIKGVNKRQRSLKPGNVIKLFDIIMCRAMNY